MGVVNANHWGGAVHPDTYPPTTWGEWLKHVETDDPDNCPLELQAWNIYGSTRNVCKQTVHDNSALMVYTYLTCTASCSPKNLSHFNPSLVPCVLALISWSYFDIFFWYILDHVTFWKTTPSWPSGVVASVWMSPVCPLPVVVPPGLECLESKGCRWPSLVLAVQVQHRWLISADFSFCEWIRTNLQQNTAVFQCMLFVFGEQYQLSKAFLSNINQLWEQWQVYLWKHV